jgi:hypothetical protein
MTFHIDGCGAARAMARPFVGDAGKGPGGAEQAAAHGPQFGRLRCALPSGPQVQVNGDGMAVGRNDPFGNHQVAWGQARVEAAGDAEADERARAL